MKLSVVLITLNEESNIVKCLDSVLWADEIVVVDSGSSDRTVSLAAVYTQQIFHMPFTNFSNQKNAALEKATGDWIFLIDADEVVTKDLAAEIQTIVNSNGPRAVYAVRRRTYFFQGRMRFSGTQEDLPIRLFPRGKARFVQPVHETIATSLPRKTLRHPLMHYTTRDWPQYKKKMDHYIQLELETMSLQGRSAFLPNLLIRPAGSLFT